MNGIKALNMSSSMIERMSEELIALEPQLEHKAKVGPMTNNMFTVSWGKSLRSASTKHIFNYLIIKLLIKPEFHLMQIDNNQDL